MKKPILLKSTDFQKLNQILRFYKVADYAYMDPDAGEYGIIQIIKKDKIIAVKHWYEFITLDLAPIIVESEINFPNSLLLDLQTVSFRNAIQHYFLIFQIHKKK